MKKQNELSEYLRPDFDVTIYEMDDVITASAVTGGGVEFGKDDPNGDEGDWWG